MILLAILIIFVAGITLWNIYDLNKTYKFPVFNSEIDLIVLTNISALLVGFLVLLFSPNISTSSSTKSYTKTEVDSLIYQRVMDTKENKIFLAEGDNACRTETIDEFNKIIVTNLGIYKIHYPFFKGENIRIEASYLYNGNYTRAYVEVEDSEEAISKAIHALYREKLLEILNINHNNYDRIP